MRTLVLGGARSGKSAWAEQQLLSAHPGETLGYIATARPWPEDKDFTNRIVEHQQRRQAQAAASNTNWLTLDTQDAPEILGSPAAANATGASGFKGSFLLDDAGTWLTHLFDVHQLWDRPRGACTPLIADLVAAIERFPTTFGCAADLMIISPEVGLSVVPETPAGRLFRDELGSLNQQLAAVCDQVVLVVAGCPLIIKSP